MRRVARSSFLVPLAVVTVAAVGFSFMLAGHRAELDVLRREEAALQAGLQEIKRQNAALREERRLLLTDVATIERVAREQYAFATPGEMFAPFAVQQEPAAAALPPAVAQDAWECVLGRGGFPWIVPLAVFFVSAVVLAGLEFVPVGRIRNRLR